VTVTRNGPDGRDVGPVVTTVAPDAPSTPVAGAATGPPAHPTGIPVPRQAPPVWAFARLALVVAAAVAFFLLMGWGAILFFIVALIVIVMLHEFGHFATAKWSGMKVTEYFVGFGPRLWSVRRGETEYGVKAIPAGGYVKIPGMSNMEEIDPGDEARTYRQKPYHQRIIVASAGSAMHILIALALAWVAVVAFGVPQNKVSVGALTVFPHGQVSPAQRAGLQSGDVIVSVDGHAIATPTQLQDRINDSAGRPVTITYTHDGVIHQATVAPVDGHAVLVDGKPIVASTKKALIIGVLTTQPLSRENPVRGVGTSVLDVGRDVGLTVGGFVHFFSPSGLSHFFGEVANSQTAAKEAQNPAQSGRVLSLIGAGRAAVEAQHAGYLYVIELLIALNIAFALLNMLPMLPLDGGHVAIAIYERARTRKGGSYYRADAAKLLPVAYAFMAFLLVITVSAMFLDIAHPVANPFP
jgi:membrane-associated protease RseP (regulator of RpoE activity)